MAVDGGVRGRAWVSAGCRGATAEVKCAAAMCAGSEDGAREVEHAPVLPSDCRSRGPDSPPVPLLDRHEAECRSTSDSATFITASAPRIVDSALQRTSVLARLDQGVYLDGWTMVRVFSAGWTTRSRGRTSISARAAGDRVHNGLGPRCPASGGAALAAVIDFRRSSPLSASPWPARFPVGRIQATPFSEPRSYRCLFRCDVRGGRCDPGFCVGAQGRAFRSRAGTDDTLADTGGDIGDVHDGDDL